MKKFLGFLVLTLSVSWVLANEEIDEPIDFPTRSFYSDKDCPECAAVQHKLSKKNSNSFVELYAETLELERQERLERLEKEDSEHQHCCIGAKLGSTKEEFKELFDKAVKEKNARQMVQVIFDMYNQTHSFSEQNDSDLKMSMASFSGQYRKLAGVGPTKEFIDSIQQFREDSSILRPDFADFVEVELFKSRLPGNQKVDPPSSEATGKNLHLMSTTNPRYKQLAEETVKARRER